MSNCQYCSNKKWKVWRYLPTGATDRTEVLVPCMHCNGQALDIPLTITPDVTSVSFQEEVALGALVGDAEDNQYALLQKSLTGPCTLTRAAVNKLGGYEYMVATT